MMVWKWIEYIDHIQNNSAWRRLFGFVGCEKEKGELGETKVNRNELAFRKLFMA